MNCLEFRRRTLADPGDSAGVLAGHRLGCRPCAAWAERQRQLDARIATALSVPVPEGLGEQVRMRASWSRPRRARWPAIAAAVVLTVAAVVGVDAWRDEPLADAVVDHIYHEPGLLVATDGSVDRGRLDAVLARIGGSSSADIGDVTHAGLCPIRGRLAAHLVVAGRHGPIAVLVMPGQGIATTTRVADGTLHGAILPVGGGSIAIVGFRDEQLDELVDRIRQSLTLEV